MKVKSKKMGNEIALAISYAISSKASSKKILRKIDATVKSIAKKINKKVVLITHKNISDKTKIIKKAKKAAKKLLPEKHHAAIAPQIATT